MTPEEGKKLLKLKNIVTEKFVQENWLELGALTGQLDTVRNHGRLLRSLSFGDEDYGASAFFVLMRIANAAPENLGILEEYVKEQFPPEGVSISSADALGKRIYFTPNIFEVPDAALEPDLLSAMMPFGAEFTGVHAAIVEAAAQNKMRCQRADDIWVHSTVIQDVFSLIFRSQIVVCDFPGKNPNVFYEAGIAHTLGKHVIPITQNEDHIPFDLQAHRYLFYHDNIEGRAKLTRELARRISTLHG